MSWFKDDKKKPKSGGYNRSDNYDHDPDSVCTRQDVFGTCTKCKHKGQATQTTYWSGEVLIRCSNCGAANQFVLDGEAFDDPRLHRPFRGDEDDQNGPEDNSSGRYSRGRR